MPINLEAPADADPATLARFEEKRELMRRAAASAIDRFKTGQEVDPFYVQWAEQFVAANPALQRPLGSGE